MPSRSVSRVVIDLTPLARAIKAELYVPGRTYYTLGPAVHRRIAVALLRHKREVSRMVIVPTVGRVVWVFRPEASMDVKQPEAALVTYVHGDRLINVAGFNANGTPFALTSLTLVQPDEPKPEGNFAAWMPYQKQVAAGTIPPTLHAQPAS